MAHADQQQVRGGGLDVIQILPSLLHLLPLSPPVVMLVENSLTDVCSITDSCLRYVFLQMMSNTTPTNGVRTYRRWTG